MAKFSLSSIPSASSVLSAYASFQASAMVAGAVVSEVQSMGRRLIPQKLREKILSKFQAFAGNLSSQMTLVFHQYNNGLSNNEIFQASEIYLQTKIGPSVKRLNVSKEPGEKGLTIRVNKGEKIIDTFQGIELVWQMISIDKENKGATDGSVDIEETQQISIELSFHEKYKDKVLSSYLPHVLKRSKAVEEENKVVKLHSLSGSWNLDHPSTFETLAMDPALKKELMADLDRFVRRRQFYQRVGKVWKRGYLLYGPPGTGKSSLIAAMANYLKFHVYDLELTSLRHNSDLRRALLRTTSRSIIVIEDIDCSTDFENRRNKNTAPGQLDSQLTLSGLLNFADGIWSSCGDGRIIVFTTNHKDRLDPALLRPGRMDLHIHMSYCTADGFRLLASNYLRITSHSMFTEIEKLITEVEATPAEIAEELMKSEEPDIALAGLIKFLQAKKAQPIKANIEGEKETATGDKKPKQKAKAKLGRKKSLRKRKSSQ